MPDESHRRATRDEARARTLKLLESHSVVFIGEVALACGSLWSLEDAENLLKDLCSENLVERVPGVPVRYERTKLVDPDEPEEPK